MLYHASFCFARGVEKKIANQKEYSVAERDDGIPVIVVAAVKETISQKGIRTFKLLRTPSPHDHLPRLPILRILSEQLRCFLLGAEQHNKERLLVHGAL